MADQKLTALTAASTLAGTDIVYLVDDPGGTPLSLKSTLANLWTNYFKSQADSVYIANTGKSVAIDRLEDMSATYRLIGSVGTVDTVEIVFNQWVHDNLFPASITTQDDAQTALGILALGKLDTINSSSLIDAGVVTLAKLADASAASRLIGRNSGSAGDWEEITLGTGLVMSGAGELSVSGVTPSSYSYFAIRTVSVSGNLASTDIDDLVIVDATGVTLTLPGSPFTGFSANDWIDILNISVGDLTIDVATAGSESINATSTNSITVGPGEMIRIIYTGATDPQWRAPESDAIAFAASRWLGALSGDTEFGAKTFAQFGSAILELTAVAAAGGDSLMFADTSDSNNAKRRTIDEIIDDLSIAKRTGSDAAREAIMIACSDETTDLTTGTAKRTFRMPYAFTLTEVRASVTTAPTGATVTVDINEGGTTILSTKLTIDAGEKTSESAATAAVISDTSLADDAEITIDIDQIGSTVAGAGLKVVLIGYKT